MGNCFTDIYSGNTCIIGIKDYKHCCNPLSNLYINDIEGITLKSLAGVSNEDYESGYAMAQHIIVKSIKMVNEDFKQFMLPFYNMNLVNIRNVQDEFDITFNSATTTKRGVVIERVESQFAKIVIKELQILVHQDGVVNIEVHDGLNIIPYVVTCEKDIIKKVYINLKCDSDEVYVLMDASGLETAKKDSGDIDNCGCDSCCSSCGNPELLSSWGWNGTGKTSELYGLRVVSTLECDAEEIICTIIDKLYYLYWLKSGIEFCKERETSQRLNNIVLFNAERSKEVRERLQDDYSEKFKTLTQNLQNYFNNYSDICITCKKNKHGYINV